MQIENLIKESVSASPGRLAEILVELSHEYSVRADKIKDILVLKTSRWMDIRQEDGVKSDKMADRIWDNTPEGRDEIELRSTLKRLEKHMSSIKTLLRVREGEAHNIY